jgi:phospholipid/cholesterol/gamma-HCH transport system substrate-binding protein
MDRFSDTLAKVPLIATFKSFDEVLANIHDITQKISAGEGSVGKLLVSDSLYSAILATNASLNRLIEDVRIHPNKYIKVSLTDKSKSVYATNDSELSRAMAGEGSSDFYICLLQSPTPIAPDDPAVRSFPSIEFIQVGSFYYYFVYHNQKIEPCLKRLEKIRKQNPAAGIFTWVDGKWKRLAI